MASFTVRMPSAASSGISRPNSSSKRHHQFDRVEAVRTQIVDKAGVVGDLRIIDTEVLDDNLLHALGGIAHDLTPLGNTLPQFTGPPGG